MKRPNIPKQKSSRIVTGFGISVIIYTIIIVVFGPVRNTAIPYLVDCSGVNCDFTNLGSSILEVFIGIFIAMLIYKLQTDSSKKLDKVKEDVTEKIYSRNVREYTCDFGLDELIDTTSATGEKEAEERVLERAKKFIDNIEKNAITVTDSEIQGRGKSHLIELSKGIIEITLPKIAHTSKPPGTKSVNLHLKTKNLEILDDVIKINKFPYWDFQWNFDENYDIQQLIKTIEEKTGKTPGSKSGIGSRENTLWTMADYGLPRVNNHGMVVRIGTNMIGLTCQSSPIDGGIFHAHKILTPGKLISILFGEKTHQEVKKIIESLFKQ